MIFIYIHYITYGTLFIVCSKNTYFKKKCILSAVEAVRSMTSISNS